MRVRRALRRRRRTVACPSNWVDPSGDCEFFYLRRVLFGIHGTLVASNSLRCSSPCWLVSVQNITEARLAASFGADIIDFKNPKRGALAPTSTKVWQSGLALSNEHRLSAAIGESLEAHRRAAEVPSQFRFAKMGPSGIRTESLLRRTWGNLNLPASVRLVAVAYADYDRAESLSPKRVLSAARDSGLRYMLIDTFGKEHGSLQMHLPPDQLRGLVEMARHVGIDVLLAGSLSLSDVESLMSSGVRPYGFGVRGDVCEHLKVGGQRDRTSRLCADRLAVWKEYLSRHAAIEEPAPTTTEGIAGR